MGWQLASQSWSSAVACKQGEDGRQEMYQQFQDLNQKNKLCGMAEHVVLIADSSSWSAILSYTDVMTLGLALK